MVLPLYSPKALASPYWNAYLETMPREQLDALHLRRVQGLIRFAYEQIPMYRELYDRAGMRPEDIRSLDDYVRCVPTIDKGDVMAYQQKAPPYGQAIVQGCEDYITLIYKTSGTTGRPMMEPGSVRDISNLWTWLWWAHGLRPSDIVYLAFNFGTFMGFWSAYYDAVLFGAQVISGGGVDSRTAVLNIMELHPTLLLITPTYALRLAEVARDMGVDLASSSLRLVNTSGEPGPQIPKVRQALEEAWGARVIDQYGISELWGCTSWSCPLYPERLHLTEAAAYGVVLDEQGRLVEEGGVGEFVFTSYHGGLQPLIKYRTHDLVEWHRQGCGCGRTWLYTRGGVLGRTDQMVVIKGTNVYAAAIQAILGEMKGLSEHLEIHIDREEWLDTVEVKVEPEEGVGEDEYPLLQQQAEGELRRNIGVRIGVEVVAPKSLPRYELKAKRVFDHRQR